MKKGLTMASLFDGSGGFPLAAILCGIEPIWASEIAPFPIRVTTKRLPKMKHYGDISKINSANVEAVDIITFGSPCQDLSLAGKRNGLDGERSGLFYEAVRIIKEMREATNGKQPRYIIWENVYGAFSSNNGEDFRCVLGEIAGIKNGSISIPRCEQWRTAGEIMADDFSIAWRGLNASGWGVPQRRKRIFLVADFNGTGAAKILFESEGVSRYSAKSFRAWQEFARNIGKGIITAEQGIAFDGYNGSIDDVISTLGVNCGQSTGRSGVMVLNDQGGKIMNVSEDITATLRSQMSSHPPLVIDPLVIENHPADSRVVINEDGQVQALTSRMGTGGGNIPLIGIPYTLKVRCGKEGGGKGALIQENQSATLSCCNDQVLFAADARNASIGDVMPAQQESYSHTNNGGGLVLQAFGISAKDSNGFKSNNPDAGIYETEIAKTLDTSGGNPSCNQGGLAVVAVDMGGGKSSCSIEDNLSPTLATTHGGAPVVAVEENDAQKSNDSFGPYYSSSKASYYTEVMENQANTLVATDYKDPPAVDFYSQMKAECMTPLEEEMPTLLNGSSPGFHNGVIQREYIVRRLLPTECARLQGFPDWWCDDLNKDEMGIDFWRNVWNDWCNVINTKPKTDKQILKWLEDPYAEAEEYKMWGNGVALPCVVFVMAGIEAWDEGKIPEEDEELPLLAWFMEEQ